MAERKLSATGRAVAILWAVMTPAFLDGVARASPAEAPAPATPAERKPSEKTQAPGKAEIDTGWQFHGAAKEEFRGRQSGTPDERDQDVDLYLDFAATDPSGRFLAEGAAATWWDIDGTSRAPGFGLRSLRETSEPSLWVDVYKLSAEYRSVSDVVRLARAGRQEAEHGQPEIFDGAAVELRPVNWLGLFAFGGRTEHFYDLKPDVSEDWLGSAGAVLRPVANLKLDLDFRLMSEDVPVDFDGSKTPLTSVSYGATGTYRFGEWLRAKLYARGLDASLSNAGGALTATNHERLMGIDVRIDSQTVAIKEINEADDPYFLILGDSLPYARWRLDVWKGFSTPAGLYAAHLGYEGRNLLRDDETAFNRNTARAYALLAASDVGIKGPFASLVFERNGAGLDLAGQGIWALGGSAGWDRGVLRAEAGTYYQRFVYTYYQDVDELADVRVFFGDVRVRAREWISARARYQYEAFDREIHTLIVGLTQAW